MADKLIIEIDGNATGLTRELNKADARLNTFNRKVTESNRALQSFQTKINTTVNAITRLSSSARTLDTSVKGVNRSLGSLNTGINRLSATALKTNTSVRQLGSTSSRASSHLTKLGTSAQAVNNMMTSMGRRMNALNATISQLNTALRSVTRNIQANGAAGINTTNIVNNYNRALRSSAAASSVSSAATNRLSMAQLGLAESFRRTVAQITALRTLTYQAAFWFAPLVYSIIKVNSEYEKQKVLLENIATATDEAGKKQEAMQSITYLRGLAMNAPFAMEAITDAFVKMRVGGIEPTNGSLQTLLDSVAAFGGDSNNLKRAAVAIQQMGGKGTVSMEELRQQLGEHVPTALKAMAKGLGYAEGEIGKFYKAIEMRQVSAQEGLSAMFRVLKEENEGKAEAMMNTWSGQIARLQTAWSVAMTKITENDPSNSFFATLKQNVERLTNFLNSQEGTDFLVQVQNALAKTAQALTWLATKAYENREMLARLAVAMLSLMAVRTVITIVGSLAKSLGMVLSVGTGVIGTMGKVAAIISRTGGIMGLFSAQGLRMATSIGLVSSSFVRLLPLLGAALGFLGPIGIGLGIVAAAYYFFGDSAREASEKQDQLNKQAKLGEGFLQNLRKESKSTGEELGGPLVRDINTGKDAMKKMAQEAANLINKLYGTEAAAYRAARALALQRVASTRTRHSAMEDEYTRISNTKSDYVSVDMKTMSKKEALAYQGKKLQESYKNYNNAGHDLHLIDKDFEKRFDAYQDSMKPKEVDTGTPTPPSDGGKSKGSKGPKSDGLEGTRNTVENAIVRFKELSLELENVKTNSDAIFDSEAAQEYAEGLTRGLGREELQKLKREYQSYTKELEKTIQVEKAIISLKDKTADTLGLVELGYARLEAGYDSIALASKEFTNSLEREYRAELAIIESRMANGTATEEQIKQYERLKMAVLDATRAKEAELVLQAAIEANNASEEYRKSFQSAGQNRLEELAEEKAKIDEALDFIDGRSYEQAKAEIYQQVDDALEKRREAEAALADAKARGDEQAQQEASNLIYVYGEAITKANDLNLALERGIPVLRQRREEVEREAAARAKWGGAGGPMLDWAKEGAANLNSLGESMGEMLTGEMDSLIDSFARGELAFGDFVKTMLAGLVKIIIQGLIAKAILGALGLSSPVSTGGYDASVLTGSSDLGIGLHTGGIVGSNATFTRPIDAKTFSFAKRYHTGGIVGLGPNEVPIIAEKGEGVFTEEQMKALGGGNSKPSNVQVNVINQTGTEAQVERKQPRFDGEKWVEDIILKKMTQPGPVRNLMGRK